MIVVPSLGTMASFKQTTTSTATDSSPTVSQVAVDGRAATVHTDKPKGTPAPSRGDSPSNVKVREMRVFKSQY